ncbi:MAG: hypothetical protein EA405_07505 [Rhodospirillales bacterium]|nr:MAG: hypothetical protein EA405_07505 [Rhodospirillales bacterium]
MADSVESGTVAPTATDAAAVADHMTDAASGQAPVLHQRFEIDARTPLPAFDNGTSRAYAVTDRLQAGRALFALVCSPVLPFRAHVLERLNGSLPSGLLPLVDHGLVSWAGERVPVLVYVRPEGGAVGAVYGRDGRSIAENDIIRRIATPIVRALRGLDSSSVSHRNIRLGNLYFLDEGRSELVLGDCVAGPPGMAQPIASEPVERAIASPAGRGEGGSADDVYALGVALVSLLLGYDPIADTDDDDIIMAKLERGSYSVLCERQRVPLAMLEPLRGMLCDEPLARWSLDELQAWISGGRTSLPRRTAGARPAAPFAFGRKEHFSFRTLARAFSKDVVRAGGVIRAGHLELWLRQRVRDEDLANRVADQVHVATKAARGNANAEQVLVSRVAMLLDPRAPICFQGLNVMPDGIGPLLAQRWLGDGDAQTPAALLQSDLPGFWLWAQGKDGTSLIAAHRQIPRLHFLIGKQTIGYGLERCLYETNPGIPCQSPLVRGSYVLTLERLLIALDRAAGTAGEADLPMDRHIAAFIASRSEGGTEALLAAIGDASRAKVVLGTLGLLAQGQRACGGLAVPRLSAWMARLLPPVIDEFHHRRTRREVEKRIKAVAPNGLLTELSDIVNDQDRRMSDMSGFMAASAAFEAASTRIRTLESDDPRQIARIQEAGRSAAATASILASAVAVCLILMSHLL